MTKSPDEPAEIPQEGGTQESGVGPDRRRSDRSREDADWESKVLGRIGGHLRQLNQPESENVDLGWEAEVLDTLRRRIATVPKKD